MNNFAYIPSSTVTSLGYIVLQLSWFWDFQLFVLRNTSQNCSCSFSRIILKATVQCIAAGPTQYTAAVCICSDSQYETSGLSLELTESFPYGMQFPNPW